MPAWGKAVTAAAAAFATRDSAGSSKDGALGLSASKSRNLPHFLQDNPLPHGYPWGSKSAKSSNPYSDPPNTGVTRHYTWNISSEPCAPDGFQNTCLLINGQFPGPLIEANWGDCFEIEVTNNIPDEGTSIHWHGLLQKATPYMDGVPGNSQCPIASGKTFTYRFQADLYGTSWYHSHYSAQYASGLAGPMVIYGPKNVQYDEDLGAIMISDYYHEYYTANVEKTLANPVTGQPGPPLADNNLINGKTNNGGSSIATFNVTAGKTYRMRLINPSAASVQKFTIDGYNFTVFANDFVPVEPYETNVVTLAVGQRTDILFNATGKSTDAVWMRGYRPPPCGPSTGNEEVLAAIFYQDADQSVLPTTQAGPNAYNENCGNDPLSQTVPFYPMAPPEPDVTKQLALNFTSNGTALLWYFNGQTFRIDYNDPMLLEAKLGNADQFPAIRNAHIYDGSINSVRIVIENPITQPHPFHLHGHNIWVLQEGPCSSLPGPASEAPAATSTLPASVTSAVAPTTTNYPSGYSTTTSTTNSSSGNAKRDADSQPRIWYDVNGKRDTAPANSCWDGSIVNPQNPQRRDVHMLQAQSYVVLQWVQDNPGVWPLHCHIAWHLSAGMAYMVVENPSSIEQEMRIPSIMAQTCRDWAAFSNTTVVDQIDDGI